MQFRTRLVGREADPLLFNGDKDRNRKAGNWMCWIHFPVDFFCTPTLTKNTPRIVVNSHTHTLLNCSHLSLQLWIIHGFSSRPDRVFFCITSPFFPFLYPISSVKLHYLEKENGVWKSKVGIDDRMAEFRDRPATTLEILFFTDWYVTLFSWTAKTLTFELGLILQHCTITDRYKGHITQFL